MGDLLGVLLLVVLVVLAVWAYLARRKPLWEWLPGELKEGRLVMVEQDLFVPQPWPVAGRPDQVYRLADGLHAPMDYKTRAIVQIYDNDVAQVSLQAWLLRRNGLPTGPFGYLAIADRKTGRRKVLRIDLYDDKYCERLIARYLDVIARRVPPRKNKGAQCRTCGHSQSCQKVHNERRENVRGG